MTVIRSVSYSLLALLAGILLIWVLTTSLPLYLVLASPLRIFVSVQPGEVYRFKGKIQQQDIGAFWEEMDKFANNYDFQLVGRTNRSHLGRAYEEYERKDKIRCIVTIPDGLVTVSFLLTEARKGETFRKLVGAFQETMPDLASQTLN